MTTLTKGILKCAGVFLFLISFEGGLFAAPYWGENFNIKQPDGSTVKVKVWGDEYYRRVYTPDGYTLINNKEGWACFAALNRDATDFVPTDVIYTGDNSPTAVLTRAGVRQNLQLSKEIRKQKAMATMRMLEVDEAGVDRILNGDYRNTRQVVGDIKGLTILIDFSDDPATINQQLLDDFANKIGWTENGNNGSVHDYFYDVSGQQLNYTNHVTTYYRAKQPKTYYNDANASGRARELVLESLEWLEAQGFDFSTLTTNSSNQVKAMNILYAGSPDTPWSVGLWPHSGSVSGFSADGVSLRRYQMTSIGNSLSIGTFCHENGHMVCGYPDLYDYDSDSKGIGRFGLMCSGGGKNPIPPCAPLRDYYTKWDTVTDISNASAGTVFSHNANSNTSFKYINSGNSEEAFYIEARRKTGRSSGIPDEGLAIWHFDRSGSNNNQEMTPESHYRVSLEQADNEFAMENDQNSGDNTDLFDKDYKSEFNDGTAPDAKWWDGNNSGLDIANISEIGDVMTFTIGDYALALTAPNAGEIFYVDDEVDITWTIFDQTIQNVKIQLSTDNGQSFTEIVATVTNNGTYKWKVPDVESKESIIKLSDTDDDPAVLSGVFTIKREGIISATPNSFSTSIDQGSSSDDKLGINNGGRGSVTYSITSTGAPGKILVNELYVSKNAFFDGIELWNQGTDQDMTGWKVVWKDSDQTSGEYAFNSGFIFKSGKTLVLTDDDGGSNDSTLYMGANVAWSQDDGTELSVAVVNDQGKGVDFVRSAGNTDTSPEGTEWNGTGPALDNNYVYRTRNEDNDDATDWASGSAGTVNKLNPGQSITRAGDYWLTVSPEEGTIDSMANLEVTVTFDASNIDAGTHVDTLLIFHDARNVPSPIKIVCTLEVNGTAIKGFLLTGGNSIILRKHGLVIRNVERLPVSIAVYDIRGRLVARKKFRASTDRIQFNTAQLLAAGAYVYKIIMGNNILRQRFIISK